jgi:2-keto-4-pentenoate hydratase/2-oxohepta-3-ene-1,7-dioic acid hydratase in catechol pathway
LLKECRKPSTALADPYPSPTPIPKHTVSANCADYESELVIVIGKTAKNVSESEAPDFILGYTAGNDVSSRNSQFSQTQWCYSKGFDKAAPIGPVIASSQLVGDLKNLKIRGLHNGKVQQQSGIE